MKKTVVRVSREAHDTLKKQRETFKKKFGREPDPENPLFFDPDYDVPIRLADLKLENELTKAARKAGLDVERVGCRWIRKRRGSYKGLLLKDLQSHVGGYSR